MVIMVAFGDAGKRRGGVGQKLIPAAEVGLRAGGDGTNKAAFRIVGLEHYCGRTIRRADFQQIDLGQAAVAQVQAAILIAGQKPLAIFLQRRGPQIGSLHKAITAHHKLSSTFFVNQAKQQRAAASGAQHRWHPPASWARGLIHHGRGAESLA